MFRIYLEANQVVNQWIVNIEHLVGDFIHLDQENNSKLNKILYHNKPCKTFVKKVILLFLLFSYPNKKK